MTKRNSPAIQIGEEMPCTRCSGQAIVYDRMTEKGERRYWVRCQRAGCYHVAHYNKEFIRNRQQPL